MSGSYDRPVGPPTLQPTQSSLEHDPYSMPHSVPVGPPPKLETGRAARTRSKRNDPTQTTAPIVPAGSVTGRSLTLVITIMCFLACLTAGAVYMMNQSASAWMRDIASEVTV